MHVRMRKRCQWEQLVFRDVGLRLRIFKFGGVAGSALSEWQGLPSSGLSCTGPRLGFEVL